MPGPVLTPFLASTSLALWLGLSFFGDLSVRAASNATSDFRVATFTADVTPPLGHPLCGGWIKPLEAVDDPLLAKGLVLQQGGQRYVLCAVDWCLLQTTAHDAFRHKLAAAAGVPVSQVSVHTVHQHNAPIADATAQRLLDREAAAPPHLDLDFLERVTDRVAASVRASLDHLQPVTGVGHGQAMVERFAGNRRVRLADGQIHVRYSATTDPQLQAAPVGRIDPWLKTVTFFQGDRPLVRLHYYASHPQSYYGDGRATSDTVGLARERLERQEKVPQIYFTGCAGNVTAGKFNDGSRRARAELTDRIFAAMERSIAATEREPVGALEWKTTSITMPLRSEPDWAEPHLRQTLSDTNATVTARLKSALDLAWVERLRTRPKIELSRLRLGPITLLQLPGEAFVEYQLYAQSLRPRDFIAVAAYGDGGPGYVCLDAALGEGGYEPTLSRVGPPTEFNLKAGIARLLAPTQRTAPPSGYADKLHLLSYRDSRGVEHPVTSVKEWQHRRADIVASLQQVMGPLAQARDSSAPLRLPRPAPEVRIRDEAQRAGYIERRIELRLGPGDTLTAYWLVPSGLKGKRPAALCLHQTIDIGKAEPVGLGGSPDLHYGRELAERGYVVLAPDYPGFGESHTDSYALGYASATAKGVWNHLRAVDFLVSLDNVDPHRLAAVGHSLGGHNALFVAAFDPRIRAVVTSCGFNSFFKYYQGDLTGWSHRGYLPRIASEYACDPNRLPFDFTEVLAALAPRPVFINAPMADSNFEVSGVKDCLAAARPVYDLFGAGSHLIAAHPNVGHAFPPDVRQQAYAWLDEWMK